MTRINTYHPRFLSNSHLIAEYRELPRVPNRVASGKPYKTIPETFRLNTGHESFFGNKIQWLDVRHSQILAEMQRRTLHFPDRFSGNYSINIEAACAEVQRERPDLYNYWEPTKEAHLELVKRVIERMLASGKADYMGDHKLDTPQAVWKHVVHPLYLELGYHEICAIFAEAVQNLDTIKAEAELRRADVRVKKAKEKKNV